MVRHGHGGQKEKIGDNGVHTVEVDRPGEAGAHGARLRRDTPRHASGLARIAGHPGRADRGFRARLLLARMPQALQGAEDKEGFLVEKNSGERGEAPQGVEGAPGVRPADGHALGVPTVVSLFAGCGGSSLGYKMAGFSERLAVEWDAHAAETFRLNFPGVPVFEGDIATLSGDEAMRSSRLAPGALDVLDGSPPCQGFSLAGRRVLDDPRNGLFKEYVRLLSALRPRTMVMENVTGLVKGYMKSVYLDIVSELRGRGYDARGEIMNAKWYGVPQARKRVIIIGVRSDLRTAPGFPKPSAKPTTCREALEGLIPDAREREILLAIGLKGAAFRHWDRLRPGDNLSRLTGGAGFSCVKYHPNRPAPTMLKNDGNIRMHGGMHWAERRRFTLGEYKRFSSFPDDFKFPETGDIMKDWSGAVARMGNSVPPLLMRAIAGHIRAEILERIDRKAETG